MDFLSRYIIRRIDKPSMYVSARELGEMSIDNFDTREKAESARKMLDEPEEFVICEVGMVIEDP